MTERDHSPATGHHGQSVRDEPVDRRSRRSRRMLAHALLALLREKPYRKITVQDIVDRADVGRSTFYDHFSDKDELFATSVGEMLATFVRPAGDGIRVQALFEHVAEQHELYRAISRARLVDQMFRVGQVALAESLEHALASDVPRLGPSRPDNRADPGQQLGRVEASQAGSSASQPTHAAAFNATPFEQAASERVRKLSAAASAPRGREGQPVGFEASQVGGSASLADARGSERGTPYPNGDGAQPIGVPPAIRANHLAGSALTLLRWWLDHEMPYPPAEMDRIVRQLIGDIR